MDAGREQPDDLEADGAEAAQRLEEETQRRRSSAMSSAAGSRRSRRRRRSSASSVSSGGSSMNSVVEVPIVSEIFSSEILLGAGGTVDYSKGTSEILSAAQMSPHDEEVAARGAPNCSGGAGAGAEHRLPQDGEILPQHENGSASTASESRRGGVALVQSQIAELFVNQYVEMAMAVTSILYMCLVYIQVSLSLPGSADALEVWKGFSVASLVFLSIFSGDVMLRMLSFGHAYWATIANCLEFAIVMAALALEAVVFTRLVDAASSGSVPGVSAVTIINSLLKLLLFIFRYRHFEYILSIKYLQAQARLSNPHDTLSASDRVVKLLKGIRRKYPLTTREAQEVSWATFLIMSRRLFTVVADQTKADEDTEKLFEGLDDDTTNWLLTTYSRVQLQESGTNGAASPPESPQAAAPGARLSDLGESESELMPAFSLDDDGGFMAARGDEEPDSEKETSLALHRGPESLSPSSPRLGHRLDSSARDAISPLSPSHFDATSPGGPPGPEEVGASGDSRNPSSPMLAPRILSAASLQKDQTDARETPAREQPESPSAPPQLPVMVGGEGVMASMLPSDDLVGPPTDLGRHISGGSLGIQARDLTLLIEALLRETYTPPITPDHVPAANPRRRQLHEHLTVEPQAPVGSKSFTNLSEMSSKQSGSEQDRPGLSVSNADSVHMDSSEATMLDTSSFMVDASSTSLGFKPTPRLSIGSADQSSSGNDDEKRSDHEAHEESHAAGPAGKSPSASPNLLPQQHGYLGAPGDQAGSGNPPALQLKPLSLHNRSQSTSVQTQRRGSKFLQADAPTDDEGAEWNLVRHHRTRTSGADRDFSMLPEREGPDYYQLPAAGSTGGHHSSSSSPTASPHLQRQAHPQQQQQRYQREHQRPGTEEPVELVGADGIERLKLLAGELSKLKGLRWTQGQLDSLNDSLDEWDFDVFDADTFSAGRPLSLVMLGALRKNRIFEQFRLLRLGMVVNMISNVENGYRTSNPYHNRVHAADVVQTTHYFMTHTLLRNAITTQDVFCALVAASIHDYQHPGMNNAFLVATGDDLALRYNDRAVLEHMHVAAAFEMMRSKRCDVLKAVGPLDRYLEARETVIQMVLATDMSHHFEGLEQFNSGVVQYFEALSAKHKARGHNVNNLTASSLDSVLNSDVNGDIEGGAGPEGANAGGGDEDVDPVAPLEVRRTLLKTTLHCADVSNPAKNPRLCQRWAMLVQEEFFRQGDREREAGLKISTFMDRTKPAFPKSQIGFITIIVRPLFNSYCQFLSTLKPQVDWCLSANLSHWEKKQAEEEAQSGLGAAAQTVLHGGGASQGAGAGSPQTGPGTFQRRKSFRFVSSRIKTTLSRSQSSAATPTELPLRRRGARSSGLAVEIPPPPSPRGPHARTGPFPAATPTAAAASSSNPSSASTAASGSSSASRMGGPPPLRRSATDMAINIGRSSSSHRFLP